MKLRFTKKDIESLVNDFIADCVIFVDLHPEKNADKVKDLISEAIKLGDGLFKKANHPQEKDENDKTVKLTGKGIKAYYKGIDKDLYTGIDSLYQKLSALAK